eukprot:gnl/MRDRNA2_/MRDRNA2_115696_c0_seq1.p1 gnl/MRDRNA2_/MRDRNA2_115696_c0~~gnl/MRDRNA2_/MRDRNA2_115696_c0_seq1.p1  ORF type:complete len:294 (-),score=57.98 gnl/MRDRNA2_/MRDRNA2_115696_c0_seq1:116-997(-)
MAAEKEQLRVQWLQQFQKASQADSWGQVVEAQEQYQLMASTIAAKQGNAFVTSSEKDTMHRIVLCLSARVTALKTLKDTITSTDMKKLEPVFETLFTGNEYPVGTFPIEPNKFQNAQPVKPSTEGEIICADREEAYSDWQHAEAALSNVRGTVVCMRVEKIGLKDAQDYIDPFITLIVADTRQNILDQHNTPIAPERRATHVIFNHAMYLNISLEDMQRCGAAIFFEFKHYKPKKKKTSTRCWCFMELNELKRDEEMVLEIYHKPTDLKKKKLNLHSEKPLYMHLFASFIKRP